MDFDENLSSFKKGRKRPLSFMGFFVDLRTRTHCFKFGLEPILRRIIQLRRLSSQRPIIDLFLLSLHILQPSCLLCSLIIVVLFCSRILHHFQVRFMLFFHQRNPNKFLFSLLVYNLVEKVETEWEEANTGKKIMLENLSNAASCCCFVCELKDHKYFCYLHNE